MTAIASTVAVLIVGAIACFAWYAREIQREFKRDQ
jgi:hypothetical protein